MSTTFGITIRKRICNEQTYLDQQYEIIKVAFRSSTIKWLHPLVKFLPDNTEVEALDNAKQGINTIGDIRKKILEQKQKK
jgi:hypothetical protein